MNGWKVDPKEIIRLIAPLRPSPLPITQQQPFGVDENESNALCEVLNWAQEEAEKVAGWVRQELAERQGDATLGDDFACLISLLRAVGPRVAAYSETSEGPGVVKGLDPVQASGLAETDLRILEQIANYPPKRFDFVYLPTPNGHQVIFPSVSYQPHISRLVWASRGLLPILAGEARLRRCPAPASNKGGQECGRYFVSGGRVGYPARYCSETCRKRAHRRKAKMRA
jgi:hypothetical protein